MTKQAKRNAERGSAPRAHRSRNAVVTGLKKRELPDVIIDMVMAYKVDMESWEVAMDEVMCIWHNIFIQSKAVRGFLQLPQASNIPPSFRQRMDGHLQKFQSDSDKFFTLLTTVQMLDREETEQNTITMTKDARDSFNEFLELDERFEQVAKLAVKAHPFEKIKKGLVVRSQK
jgi:hypothetical protein